MSELKIKAANAKLAEALSHKAALLQLQTELAPTLQRAKAHLDRVTIQLSDLERAQADHQRIAADALQEKLKRGHAISEPGAPFDDSALLAARHAKSTAFAALAGLESQRDQLAAQLSKADSDIAAARRGQRLAHALDVAAQVRNARVSLRDLEENLLALVAIDGTATDNPHISDAFQVLADDDQLFPGPQGLRKLQEPGRQHWSRIAAHAEKWQTVLDLQADLPHMGPPNALNPTQRAMPAKPAIEMRVPPGHQNLPHKFIGAPVSKASG